MLKAKICGPLLAVLLLCLQPFSYSQNGIAVPGQAVLSEDPIVDAFGNLLFFKTVVSKTGVRTDVTLISPAAETTAETYTGIFSRIKRGEQAVYAIESVPTAFPAAASSVSQSLVALVTTNSGGLPTSPVEYSLPKGSIDLLKINRGSASDVIYLVQKSSSGASVLVLTFDGTTFKLVGTVPIS